jgi:hypothetical protein
MVATIPPWLLRTAFTHLFEGRLRSWRKRATSFLVDARRAPRVLKYCQTNRLAKIGGIEKADRNAKRAYRVGGYK